jgi:hypothetical protein
LDNLFTSVIALVSVPKARRGHRWRHTVPPYDESVRRYYDNIAQAAFGLQGFGQHCALVRSHIVKALSDGFLRLDIWHITYVRDSFNFCSEDARHVHIGSNPNAEGAGWGIGTCAFALVAESSRATTIPFR